MNRIGNLQLALRNRRIVSIASEHRKLGRSGAVLAASTRGAAARANLSEVAADVSAALLASGAAEAEVQLVCA